MDKLLGDWSIDAVVIIASEQDPEEALSCLEDSSHGVVVDLEGFPVALITNDDLHIAKENAAYSLMDTDASLPPTILASGLSSAEDIVQAWTNIFNATTRWRCRGVILLGREGVEGVVPTEQLLEGVEGTQENPEIRDWQRNQDNLYRGALKDYPALRSLILFGDSQLPGEPSIGLLTIVCGICGYVNLLKEFDPDYPPFCLNESRPEYKHRIE